MRTQSTIPKGALELARDHPNDLVAVYSLKGDCVWASPSVEATLGYSQEEMVGRSWRDLVPPEDHYNAGQVGIDAFLNGTSLEFRLTAVTKAGELIPMRGNARIQLDPRRTNRYLFFVCHATRDTSRAESNRLPLGPQKMHVRTQSPVITGALELAQSNPTDIVAVYSMKGACVWASPSHEIILGYTQAEMIGHNWRDMVAPESHYDAGLAGIDAFLNGLSLQFTFQAITKSGERVPMRGKGRVKVDLRGKTTYLVFQAQPNP